jgi:hypothetical protein
VISSFSEFNNSKPTWMATSLPMRYNNERKRGFNSLIYIVPHENSLYYDDFESFMKIKFSDYYFRKKNLKLFKLL